MSSDIVTRNHPKAWKRSLPGFPQNIVKSFTKFQNTQLASCTLPSIWKTTTSPGLNLNCNGFIRVFPKTVVPQNGWFIRENPITCRIDDLGGKTLFLETPKICVLVIFENYCLQFSQIFWYSTLKWHKVQGFTGKTWNNLKENAVSAEAKLSLLRFWKQSEKPGKSLQVKLKQSRLPFWKLGFWDYRKHNSLSSGNWSAQTATLSNNCWLMLVQCSCP